MRNHPLAYFPGDNRTGTRSTYADYLQVFIMIEALISRARRRLIFNEALGQLAFAAAIAIGGLALILLFGTRWLEWWTLTLFAALGFGIGAWRVWRALPDAYTTAVRLDTTARLSDSLSTALHYSESGDAKKDSKSGEFRNLQLRQAEAAAGSVDLDVAVPFTIPRTLYLMAGCAVAASALLLLRFSAGHGLDLQAPITEVLFEDQAARALAKQKPRFSDPGKQKGLEAAESLLAKLGIPLKPEDRQSEEALSKAIDEALEGGNTPSDKGQKGPASGKSDEGKAGNGLQQNPDGDSMDGKPSSDSDQNNEAKSSAGEQGKAGDKGSPKSGQNSDNNSLLSKLKDAVSNMMSKANQDKGSAGQKGQQQQQQASKSDKAAGEKGSSGKGQEQQGQQQGEAQAGDPNGDPQEGQQAEGKAGSKSAQNSSQAGSGVGSQDGAKDLKAAEQIKAMGKISEIIGKRAATVTGETTIEVQSGNQQLRTAYTNTKAAVRGEADSDVTRDEIPVGLQSYVQSYFQQVRKAATPAKPKASK